MSTTQPKLRIAIFGAGSIGCYVGACLAAAGAELVLIGRERVLTAIQANGLTATDYKGRYTQLPASALHLSTHADTAKGADLVLVTVKSAASKEAAQALSPHLNPGVPVISFQNGIYNAEVLQKLLPNHPVLAGMVPFNVIDRGQGAFHQGSQGTLEVQADGLSDAVRKLFSKAELDLLEHADMRSVQWGKLLLNLNNPVNALSGIPLKEELSQRDYRCCVGLALNEALQIMKAAGIKPAKVTAVPPSWLPFLMDTPDWLFTRAAKKLLAIDPLARSSMWEDLELGRPTEIDWINGEVIRLAETVGMRAPVNARLIALVREAERGGSRRWAGADLLLQLQAAQ